MKTLPRRASAIFSNTCCSRAAPGWPTALDIANEIEGRGGYLNASTGYEYTSYWIKVGARHWRQGLALWRTWYSVRCSIRWNSN